VVQNIKSAAFLFLDVNIANFHNLQLQHDSMRYAICLLPLAHMRLLPDHREELTSQFVFGEHGNIIEEHRDGWILVQHHWDGYIGWCRSNQFFITSIEPVTSTRLAGGWVNEVRVNDKLLHVPFGSRIPLAGDNIPSIVYNGESFEADAGAFNADALVKFSARFLNSTYLWGGRSVFGIDCSGLVQSVYRMLNIPLLRDAHQQATQGEPIGFLQEAVCGDLAFFEEENEIMHVGMLLNDHEILHASGNVRIDPIDSAGIINADTGKRSHKLRIIKRIAGFEQ
jgi:gamma-D-glutamyl-L-lysine dipeptidyl-peptidase